MLSVAVVLGLALALPVTPGPVVTDVPADPDPRARYVFYLHGRILEAQGRDAVSPDFGRYEYDAILGALAARGFTVISEVRVGDAGQEFVDKVAGQVKALLKAGVPGKSIGVIGASKGGGLTLKVSSAVADPDVSYVVLAGCGGGSVTRGPTLHGRMLSIYDRKDRFLPSCEATFAKAAGLTERREIVLDLGLDHGLLYRPHKEWVDPAVTFLLGPR